MKTWFGERHFHTRFDYDPVNSRYIRNLHSSMKTYTTRVYLHTFCNHFHSLNNFPHNLYNFIHITASSTESKIIKLHSYTNHYLNLLWEPAKAGYATICEWTNNIGTSIELPKLCKNHRLFLKSFHFKVMTIFTTNRHLFISYMWLKLFYEDFNDYIGITLARTGV